MSNNIKGITVEIGGDTTPLNKALKDTNDSSRSLQDQLKEVNKQLKFDPSNTVLLKQKQELLTKEISNTKSKLDLLKEAEKQAQVQFEQGKISQEQYQALQREVIKTESQLKNLEKQAGLCNVSLSKISVTAGKVGDAAEAAGEKMLPATIAIAGVGAAAAKMGSDFIESENKVDVAFGTSSEVVKKFSETSLEKFGVAAGSAMDMASTFGDMATSMDIPAGKAAEMSTKLVGLAGDLSSFKNIKLDESATALNSIFTGETESLKKLGIVMTETNLSAFALSEGIQKPFDKMTESEKVQLRYEYVLDKTKNAQGDFARTSDGAANSMRVATESAKEAGESFGVLLAPVVAKVSQYVASLIKNFAGLDSGTKQIIITILGIIAAIAPTLIIAGKIFNGIQAITGAMVMMKSATLAQTAAQYGLNAALLANPVTWIVIGIVAAIAALVTAFVLLWNNCEGFRNFWIGLWNGIKGAAQAVGTWFSTDFINFFKGAWSDVTGVFNAAPAFFSGLGSKITGALNTAGDFIKENWKSLALFVVNPIAGATTLLYKYNPAFKAWADNMMKTVKDGITNGLTAITNFFTPFVNGLKNTLLSIWTPIQSGLATAWNGIKTAAIGAWELIKNVILGPVLLLIDLVTGDFGKLKTDLDSIWLNIQNAAKAVWNGILTFFVGIWQAISGGFTAFWAVIINGIIVACDQARSGIVAAWSAVTAFFTTAWITIGNGIQTAWNGFWITINSLCNTTKAGVINIWNSVIAWFQAFPGTLMTIGANMFTSMQTGVNSTVDNVTNSVKTGIGAAIDWITGLPAEALQWGKDIIGGIVDGINAAADAVGDAVKGIAQDIRKFLHFSVPDEGPLADFESWMPDFMEGLASGISTNVGKVTAAARKVAESLKSTIPTSFGTSLQVSTAMAAARGYTATSSTDTGTATSNVKTASDSTDSKMIGLTLVTPDGQTLGKFVAPYVGKQLEFNSKDLFPAKG